MVASSAAAANWGPERHPSPGMRTGPLGQPEQTELGHFAQSMTYGRPIYRYNPAAAACPGGDAAKHCCKVEFSQEPL